MKRFVCILSLLLLLLLAGCVNPNGTSESESEEESESIPFVPEDDGVPIGTAVTVLGYELIPSGDARSLADGTLVLPSGKESFATVTVDAPTAGIYKVDMKYETCGGYIQYVYLYNESYEGFTECRAETRFGDYTTADPSTAETDEDYCVPSEVHDGDFDGIPETYIYLVRGENRLRLCMTTNVAGNKLGVDSIAFTLHKKARESTVALSVETLSSPPDGYENTLVGDSGVVGYGANNGWFLRGTNTVNFEVTVPEDGVYELSVLGCASRVSYAVESASESFLPISGEANALLPHSRSTVLFSLGSLNLTKGTHVIRLSVSGGYFHVAMFLLDQVDYYDKSRTFAISGAADADLDPESGVFTLSYRVMGVAPSNGAFSLEERVTVTGVDVGGSFSESLSCTRNAYETANTFTGKKHTGLKSIRILYEIYDGDKCVYAADPLSYSDGGDLKVAFISDMHFSGSNVNQNLFSEIYGTINKRDTLKKYASDWSQCENYGLDSDRKLQAMMDDIIRQYKAGELDIVFFLGDAANNESNYDNYLEQHKNHSTDPLGRIEEFWESPLNYSYWLKKAFLDQLSTNGIPYFMANGNHDYVYSYNEAGDDLDYTEWERLYHYAELFGHRTEENNGEYLRDLETDEYICYEDSDSVHYLVRVIRRDGEVKILSALSTEELEAFLWEYEGDGNCYDFYVSEDSLTDEDELLGAFVMVNGFQFSTYDYYVKTWIAKDPVTGAMNYSGQTIRYVDLRHEFVEKMMEDTVDYGNTYIIGHLVQDVAKYVTEYGNVQAIFSGDVHNEERSLVASGVYNYVDGHNVTAFHYDKYYNADGTPDNQYYSSRSNPKYGNTTWSDFLRHPYGYITLRVAGNYSFVSRVKYAAFYENGRMTVTGGELHCNEIRYARATADPALFDPEEVLYAVQEADGSRLYRIGDLFAAGYTVEDKGVRKVYVGNDVSYIGKSYRYLCSTYTEGIYNAPMYRLHVATGKVYNLGGAYLGDAVSATGDFATEGRSVTFDGRKYYICGEVGEVWGHNLYDENGNYVFLDKNGSLVFYEAVVKGENYVEASVQENFTSYGMFAGPYERNWYYRASDGSYVSLDKDGDGILDDGIYDDLYISTGSDMHAVGGVYEPEIVIEDGRIVKGEGWCRYGYKAVYTLADGTVVDKLELSIDYDENGNIVYGVYIPTMYFAKETLVRIAP